MCMHSHADHEHNDKEEGGFQNHNHAEHQSFWRSKAAVVMLGFAAVAGFFLITEHWAHLYGWLPFLIILACPLMHIFMHHGHGGHAGHGGGDDNGHHDHEKPDTLKKPLADKGVQS